MSCAGGGGGGSWTYGLNGRGVCVCVKISSEYPAAPHTPDEGAGRHGVPLLLGRSSRPPPTHLQHARHGQQALSPPGVISTPPGCLGAYLSASHACLGPILGPCAMTRPRDICFAAQAGYFSRLHHARVLRPRPCAKRKKYPDCADPRKRHIWVGAANDWGWGSPCGGCFMLE